MNLTNEQWEAELATLVEENHRRALQLAEEQRKPKPTPKEMPMWACLLCTVAMAALAAALVFYTLY